MTIVAEAPAVSVSAGVRLQDIAIGVRVEFRPWLGGKRGIKGEKKERMANAVDAQASEMAASIAIFGKDCKEVQAINAIRSDLGKWVKDNTFPYTDKSVRLLKQERLTEFQNEVMSARGNLRGCKSALMLAANSIAERRRPILGALFNEADYIFQNDGFCNIVVDYPNLNADEKLLQLSPRAYEEQCALVRAKFEESVKLFEHGMAEQLRQLMADFVDKMQPKDGGERKIFRDSAVTNLRDFFERFHNLNLHSSEELDNLVKQAQDLTSGITPTELRQDPGLRQEMAEQFARLRNQADSLLEELPSRALDLPPMPEENSRNGVDDASPTE